VAVANIFAAGGYLIAAFAAASPQGFPITADAVTFHNHQLAKCLADHVDCVETARTIMDAPGHNGPKVRFGFVPQAGPQQAFIECPCDIVVYGGARGILPPLLR